MPQRFQLHTTPSNKIYAHSPSTYLNGQAQDNGGKGKELEHSVRARNEMSKRLSRRKTAESSLHSIALQMNGRALTKLHDAGRHTVPSTPFPGAIQPSKRSSQVCFCLQLQSPKERSYNTGYDMQG